MSGIRVTSKSAERVEVNDNGDYIEIDYADPMFISRVQEGMEKIATLEKKYEHINTFINSKTDEEDLLSDKSISFGKDLKNYYLEGRRIIDLMLGDKQACQKIFGHKNWFLMFDELFEQLNPYFEKAEKGLGKYLEETKKKYANRATRRSKKGVMA